MIKESKILTGVVQEGYQVRLFMYIENLRYGFYNYDMMVCSTKAGVCVDPTSWQEAVQIVNEGTVESLSKLGRSPLGIKYYREFLRDKILTKFVSVTDYLLCTVFSLPTESGNAAIYIHILHCSCQVITSIRFPGYYVENNRNTRLCDEWLQITRLAKLQLLV